MTVSASLAVYLSLSLSRVRALSRSLVLSLSLLLTLSPSLSLCVCGSARFRLPRTEFVSDVISVQRFFCLFLFIKFAKYTAASECHTTVQALHSKPRWQLRNESI